MMRLCQWNLFFKMFLLLPFVSLVITTMNGVYVVDGEQEFVVVHSADSMDNKNNKKDNIDWLHHCRSIGYDPYQLACHTCQLLPLQVQNDCIHCCQDYKDVERITKPFQYAIIIQMTKQVTKDSEIDQFMKEDLHEIMKKKEMVVTDSSSSSSTAVGQSRVMKIIDELASTHERNIMKNNYHHPMYQQMFQFFQTQSKTTAEIIFLDESPYYDDDDDNNNKSIMKKKKNQENGNSKAVYEQMKFKSYDELISKSKEIIQLDGMKRQDMKDMIMTLLP